MRGAGAQIAQSLATKITYGAASTSHSRLSKRRYSSTSQTLPQQHGAALTTHLWRVRVRPPNKQIPERLRQPRLVSEKEAHAPRLSAARQPGHTVARPRLEPHVEIPARGRRERSISKRPAAVRRPRRRDWRRRGRTNWVRRRRAPRGGAKPASVRLHEGRVDGVSGREGAGWSLFRI